MKYLRKSLRTVMAANLIAFIIAFVFIKTHSSNTVFTFWFSSVIYVRLFAFILGICGIILSARLIRADKRLNLPVPESDIVLIILNILCVIGACICNIIGL